MIINMLMPCFCSARTNFVFATEKSMIMKRNFYTDYNIIVVICSCNKANLNLNAY